eukprot:scaffold46143_cov26-Tisochrysis_lutea.AAC.1
MDTRKVGSAAAAARRAVADLLDETEAIVRYRPFLARDRLQLKACRREILERRQRNSVVHSKHAAATHLRDAANDGKVVGGQCVSTRGDDITPSNTPNARRPNAVSQPPRAIQSHTFRPATLLHPPCVPGDRLGCTVFCRLNAVALPRRHCPACWLAYATIDPPGGRNLNPRMCPELRPW